MYIYTVPPEGKLSHAPELTIQNHNRKQWSSSACERKAQKEAQVADWKKSGPEQGANHGKASMSLISNFYSAGV